MGKVAVVFVHLGNIESKTLNEYALQAITVLPPARLVLITDSPQLHIDFPGEVLIYRNGSRSPSFKKFVKQNKHIRDIANGYWLHTIERIFALGILSAYIDDDFQIIHLESDVFSFIDELVVTQLHSRIKTVGVPRISSQLGIASILYSPSLKELKWALFKLETILIENSIAKNDMELLGIGLNRGILEELPTLPEKAWVIPKSPQPGLERPIKLIFDGAALGQYLFGQDPIHTSNQVISGFQNPNFPVIMSSSSWEIEPKVGPESLVMAYENSKYRLANLHIHSKRQLEKPSNSSELWQTVLAEANGKIERIAIPSSRSLTHTGKYSIATKFRIVKAMGLSQFFKMKIDLFFKGD